MDKPAAYSVEDFNFALLPELIAQFPASERGASRLLAPGVDGMRDLLFPDLRALLQRGDLLVFNLFSSVSGNKRGWNSQDF